MATAAGSALLGRERELALVEDFLGGVRDGAGGTLLFSGEPGSGKTALLAAAAGLAGDFTLVGCRGVEWEAELPFSGLHELITPLLGHLPALPDPQRQAVEEALGLAPAQELRSLHLYAGAASLLAEATRDRPVLLVADDLQWLDSPTAQVLAFVARRLQGERLGLLLASRPGGELPGQATPATPLQPLGQEAVAALVSRRLGRTLPEEAVRTLTRAAGGNPLAIVESLTHLGDDLWLRGTPLDEPLPVGALIERGFAGRMDALSDGAQRALVVAAVSLTRDAAVIGRALDALGLGPADLAEAERAEVIVLDGARVGFVHPLLRSLAHRRAAREQLRRAHAALAEGATDPGIRAWHAASAVTEPDEAVAADLDAAAERFERLGGQLAAAQALARAGELTVDPDRKADRLQRAGAAANLAGKGRWALALTSDACEVAVDPMLRLRAIHRRTYIEAHLEPDADMPARHLAVAEAAAGIDPGLQVIALGTAVIEGLLAGRSAFADAALEQAQAVREAHELTVFEEDDLEAITAMYLIVTGRPGRAGDFGRAAICTSARLRIGADVNQVFLVEALQWLEEYALSRQLADFIIDTCRPLGDAFNLPGGLWARASHHYRLGDWAAAAIDIDEAVRVVRAAEHRGQEAVIVASQAIIQASQGNDDFRATIEETERVGLRHGFGVMTVFAATALGLADLGAGRAAEAIIHFERARAWQRDAGQVQPAFGTWPADLVEAYAQAGRREDAVQLLDELRAWADAVGRRWAQAAVARLDGLLADEVSYEVHFIQALRQYETAQDPFGRARARLGFGQRLRRSRRRVEAREHLEAALAEFERLGAAPWAEQARRELGASASTLRKGSGFDPDALTPQEAQVAGLVAGGASNKEVAASMFLSPKTIETHLSRIYRKLGVASRTQLAAKMRAPDAGPAPTPG